MRDRVSMHRLASKFILRVHSVFATGCDHSRLGAHKAGFKAVSVKAFCDTLAEQSK